MYLSKFEYKKAIKEEFHLININTPLIYTILHKKALIWQSNAHHILISFITLPVGLPTISSQYNNLANSNVNYK